MRLVFASNNRHKLEEIKQMLQNTDIEILGLQDIGCSDEIPETSDTLVGNAMQKAQYVFDRFQLNCFADDTGLEVEALNGRPGVYSARYAGEACSFDDNINKLLHEMVGITNRKACFKTVIALILDGEKYLFSGEVAGEILTERKGINGFGYDPVFMPEDYDITFAEMDAITKNGLSHRFHATSKLIQFLIDKSDSK
jgi:XTP/dITP diphosphohydrolase